MAIIWKLVETCIIPIITYGAESMNNNTQRKPEDTNNHEQHHKKNPRRYHNGHQMMQ